MKLFALAGFFLMAVPVAVSQQRGVRPVAARLAAQTAQANPDVPGQMPVDASPKFEVATIKPSNPDGHGQGFDIQGRHVKTMKTTVNNLITFAYGLHARQIVGGPEWLDIERFDVDGVPDVAGTPNLKQFRMLIQSLLADRFKLGFHHDQRDLSVYALTVGKNGPRLTESVRKPNDLPDFSIGKLGVLKVVNVTMRDFCIGMQAVVMDKPVVDQTGLTGRYDFALTWTPDQSQFFQMGTRIPAPKDEPNAPPGLYTAIQEQLGLKLQATKASADVMVIDRLERPSEN
jgi:uncharacterized protein (TIGR03435 family)